MHHAHHELLETPKVSVITITFRDPEGLLRTQLSIERQREPLDWIVVDGDPNSKAVSELKTAGKLFAGCAEADRGIYDAMAKGLALARTEYVIFLNSGDSFLQSTSLEDAVKQLRDCDVHYFAAEFRAGKGYRKLRLPRNPVSSIWHSVPGNQQATIYKRISLLGCGIPQEFRICGDYALACRLHVSGARAAISNLAISAFELGGTSTVRILDLCNEAAAVQKNILGLAIAIRALSYVIRLATAARTYIQYSFNRQSA